jgi:hypothetical protein
VTPPLSPTMNPFPPPLAALAQATSTPGPTYGHHSSYPSPPKPTFNPPPNSSYIMISPPTASPDMPSPSYSTSTSPASTATPPTPPGMEGCMARIISASSSPGVPKHEPVVPAVPSRHQSTRCSCLLHHWQLFGEGS